MRVTLDLDSKSRIKLWYVCLKGRFLIGKPPDEIYKTRKGYHIIWSGLPITFEKSIELRKKLGDDKNRIRLDLCGKKRLKNVLFDEKTIRYYRINENGERELIKQETFKRQKIK
ncbi:MAG: hypothetical protein QXY62_05890 [Candidatus Altiarchaeota archaeon]